jgi:hypothetical protein
LPHILEATNAKIQDMEESEQALNQVEQIGQVCDDIAQQLVFLDMHHSTQSESLEQLLAVEDVANAEQLKAVSQHFAFMNEELEVIKQKLALITETREALHTSLNKLNQPWSEDQVASQDDIELF